MDRTGQFILVQKHRINAKGKKFQRVFFTEAEFDQQRKVARKYADRSRTDFIIVKVIEEIEKGKGE